MNALKVGRRRPVLRPVRRGKAVCPRGRARCDRDRNRRAAGRASASRRNPSSLNLRAGLIILRTFLPCPKTLPLCYARSLLRVHIIEFLGLRLHRSYAFIPAPVPLCQSVIVSLSLASLCVPVLFPSHSRFVLPFLVLFPSRSHFVPVSFLFRLASHLSPLFLILSHLHLPHHFPRLLTLSLSADRTPLSCRIAFHCMYPQILTTNQTPTVHCIPQNADAVCITLLIV